MAEQALHFTVIGSSNVADHFPVYALYIFGVWGGIAVLNGIAAALGNLIFIGFSQQVVAATMALAAGAILAMLIDTMIPEAFEIAQHYAGIIAVTGFLCAFYLSKING